MQAAEIEMLVLLRGATITPKAYHNANSNRAEVYDQTLPHFLMDATTVSPADRLTWWMSSAHSRWLACGGDWLVLMQRGRLVQPAAAAAAAADSVPASGTTASNGAGADVEASIVDPLARADFWSRVVGLASPLKVIIAQFAAPGLYTAIHRLFVAHCCTNWDEAAYRRMLKHF